MSIACDALTLGRPSLPPVASPSQSCGGPPREERQLWENSPRPPPPVNLGRHTEGRRAAVGEAASFVWHILSSFKSMFRPSYLDLFLLLNLPFLTGKLEWKWVNEQEFSHYVTGLKITGLNQQFNEHNGAFTRYQATCWDSKMNTVGFSSSRSAPPCGEDMLNTCW